MVHVHNACGLHKLCTVIADSEARNRCPHKALYLFVPLRRAAAMEMNFRAK